MSPITMDRPPSLTLNHNPPPSPHPDLSSSDSQPPELENLSDPETTETDLSSLPTTPTTPSSTHDHDHTDPDAETLQKICQKLTHLTHLYASGKPLFPRSLLQHLDTQIDAGKEEVTIEDLDGVEHGYSLVVPGWCADFATSYRISYASIQTLTCIHPSFPEISLRDTSPISICYTSSAEIYPPASSSAVQAAFARNKRKWETSETRATLIASLQDLMQEGRLGKGSIRKIIGFGLGSLAAIAEESPSEQGVSVQLGDGYHCVRAHAQHAALGTVAETLISNWSSQSDPNIETNTEAESHEIKCYAQDPAYSEIDQALLRSIGIEPLDDPKGFLEIDPHTLIFSVSPNVPVKQVVADVGWPGAMIWNTVGMEEKEARWEKKVRNGEEFWVVPFTTDPDSQRVRDMVQNYTSVALRDFNEFLGDLTIYAR
ncbi:hypothetical protein BDV12DRAFT_76097 [Aspergillus spectabilis]